MIYTAYAKWPAMVSEPPIADGGRWIGGNVSAHPCQTQDEAIAKALDLVCFGINEHNVYPLRAWTEQSPQIKSVEEFNSWTPREPRQAATLTDLDLADKQSLVDLLFGVQAGKVSCRRAATEIMDRHARKGCAASPMVRDADGKPTRACDAVRFSYGIPPVGVVGHVVQRGNRLIVLTPGHDPEETPLRSLRGYVGEWYKVEI